MRSRRTLPEAQYRTPAGHEPPPLPHGGFGDILDSTFSVYGRHLFPFILIALLPQIPLLIGRDHLADGDRSHIQL